jgi:tRNA 2-thiouridine synthesizing protein E
MSNFPNAPKDWNESVAESAASQLGLELNSDHWSIIQALQEYFAKNDQPNRRELTDALEERFHAKGGLKYLYKLLPGGPVAQGCVISGMKPPAGSIDQSFGSVV